MNKRKIHDDTVTPRMLTIEQACTYTNRGRTSCREWCDSIGATRRFSRKLVRYDREVIDKALDDMPEATEREATHEK